MWIISSNLTSFLFFVVKHAISSHSQETFQHCPSSVGSPLSHIPLVNPFVDDVFSGSLRTEQTLPALYEREMNLLSRLIEDLRPRVGHLGPQVGTAALLISKRAGAGKTHLLARLVSERNEVAHFCPLAMHDPEEICWEGWFRQLVERLHSTKDSHGDHTALTGAAAYLLASATGALVSEGRIPCDSPATASQWLLENSVKLFDYNESDNDSVSWFQNEFPRLLPEIADRYARELDLDRGLLAARLEWLFDYAMLSATERSFSERRDEQRELLHDAAMLDIQGEGAARREWRWLGRAISQQRPLALVIDDLDWAYRDEATALRLARMLAEYSRMVPNSLALLSVNEDTWRETFEKGLPEAVVDRLTTSTFYLKGVPRVLWADFISVRVNDSGEAERLKRVHELLEEEFSEDHAVMPRRLLRNAATLWDETEDTVTEIAPARIFAKPKVDESSQLEPSPNEELSPNEEPSPNGESTSTKKQPWSHAIGDLRTFIQARENTPSSPNTIGRPITPFIDVSASEPRNLEPVAKPELTPEFCSFLSSLRARAEDKEGYLPQDQPATAEKCARERSQLILRGRESDSAVTDKAEELRPIDEDTQKVSVVANGSAGTTSHEVRLRELKLHFAEAGGQFAIQLPRLRRLIKQAGSLFPAITQEVAGGSTEIVGEIRWSFQQSEVSFGFEPFEEAVYWKDLVQSVADRVRVLREKDMTRGKLAVFGRTREESRFPSWDLDEEASRNLQYCDVILLTDHQLMAIYAVDELICEEVGKEEREAVFAQVSGELDFFWKMITRPVWTLVSPISSPALID